MESNKNLSSIISKIRDEGPPGNADPAGAATPYGGVSNQDRDALQQRASAVTGTHRTARRLLLGLVLPLAIVVVMVFFAGSYKGYRDGSGFSGIATAVKGWFVSAPDNSRGRDMTGGNVAAYSAVDEQLIRELRVQQLDMQTRLEQLTDTLTVLSETVSRNWTDNDAVIAGLRQEQHTAIDALQARVAALQQQLAGPPGKTVIKDTPPPIKPASPAVSATMPAAPRDKAAPAETDEEWVVNVASSSHEQPMQELAAKLKEQGIPVERHALTIEGDLMYRLRVPGFTTSAEARRYAEKLDKEFGIRGPWVSRK